MVQENVFEKIQTRLQITKEQIQEIEILLEDLNMQQIILEQVLAIKKLVEKVVE